MILHRHVVCSECTLNMPKNVLYVYKVKCRISTAIMALCLVHLSVGCAPTMRGFHDDVIKWKEFPRNWPFVRGIHRSPVNSPHKGQWRGALMFSLICAWINGWVSNRVADDLRHHRAHYDVTVMLKIFGKWWPFCSKLNMYVISVYLINLSVCQEQRVTIVKELRHFALKCLYELTTSPSLDDWLLFPKHILVCIPRKLNFCLKPRNLYQCRGNVLARDLHVVGIENVIVYSINLMTVLIKLCDHRPRLLSWRHAKETHDDVIKWKHFPRC